jgi:hypothetical protein
MFKKIAAMSILSLGVAAQAKEITAPVSVNMDKLFTAGTSTYLEMVSPELDKQINAVCGPNAILLDLKLHYRVKQGLTGTDVSKVNLSGTVKCRSDGN